MECSIISPGLLLLMKHLGIGQRKKAPNFSAFHWSPHGSLVFNDILHMSFLAGTHVFKAFPAYTTTEL